MAASDDVGISATTFFIAAALIVAGIGALVWFAIPGTTRHSFPSPSGQALLEIGEECSDTTCARLFAYEQTLSDGRRERSGCPIAVSGLTPLFVSVLAAWSADETTVTLDYTDANGNKGTLTVVPAVDCPVMQ